MHPYPGRYSGNAGISVVDFRTTDKRDRCFCCDFQEFSHNRYNNTSTSNEARMNS